MIPISGLFIGLLFIQDMKTGLLMDGALGLHEMSIMASYILIAIHVIAALYHRFLSDGIWSTMVPFFKEK